MTKLSACRWKEDPPFTPADNYDDLLVQARALWRMAHGRVLANSLAQQRIAQLERTLAAASNPDLVASERAANETLTNEVEALGAVVTALRAPCPSTGEPLIQRLVDDAVELLNCRQSTTAGDANIKAVEMDVRQGEVLLALLFTE